MATNDSLFSAKIAEYMSGKKTTQASNRSDVSTAGCHNCVNNLNSFASLFSSVNHAVAVSFCTIPLSSQNHLNVILNAIACWRKCAFPRGKSSTE